MSYRRSYAPKGTKTESWRHTISDELTTASGSWAETELLIDQKPGHVFVIDAVFVKKGLDVATKYQSIWLCNSSNDSTPEMDDKEVILHSYAYCHSAIGLQDYIVRMPQFKNIPIGSGKLYFGAIQDTGNAITYKILVEGHYIPFAQADAFVGNVAAPVR